MGDFDIAPELPSLVTYHRCKFMLYGIMYVHSRSMYVADHHQDHQSYRAVRRVFPNDL